MGYSFGSASKSHRRALIDLLHEIRWHEDLPEQIAGWNMRLLLETVVDELNDADGARAMIEALESRGEHEAAARVRVATR